MDKEDVQRIVELLIQIRDGINRLEDKFKSVTDGDMTVDVTVQNKHPIEVEGTVGTYESRS